MRRHFTQALCIISLAALASCGGKVNAECCEAADSTAIDDEKGPCGTTDGPQTGEEVWGKVTDWKKYIPWSDFGTIEAYAYYDIDEDGIPEAIVRGNDKGSIHYSILTCGKESGGLGDVDDIEQVVNNLEASKFCIMKGKPFVFLYSDNGDGHEYNQYHEFKGSHCAAFYSQSIITKDGKTEYKYSKVTSVITKEEYEKSVPSEITDIVDFEELDWETI